MISKEFNEYSNVLDFLRYEKTYIYSEIIKSIEYSFLEGLESIIVAEFDLLEDNMVFKIEISKEEWDESLTLALAHFAKIEEYEECIKIKDLMDKIESS